jgi:hypothetical protein
MNRAGRGQKAYENYLWIKINVAQQNDNCHDMIAYHKDKSKICH